MRAARIPRFPWWCAVPVLLSSGGTAQDRSAATTRVTRSRVTAVPVKDGWAVNYPKQRKLFHAADRLWLFYSDGRDAVYRTSRDGTRWSEPVTVRAGGHYGHRTGYAFDGTWFHYAHDAAAAGEDVVWRRGKPDSSGKIEWAGSEQVVYRVAATHNVMYPKVIVDSAGRPWVSFVLCKGGPQRAPYDAVVTHSAARDRWRTARSFPHVLVADNRDSYPDPVGVALDHRKTFWVVNRNHDQVYVGQEWTGTSWKPVEPVTETRSSYGLYNLLADGDEVHLVFGGGTLRHRYRSPKTGWSDEVEVGSGSGHASLTRVEPGRIVATWLSPGDHRIWTRELRGGWLAPVLLVDAAPARLANPTLGMNFNTLVAATPEYLTAVAYTTGTGEPFALEFAGLRR